MEMHEALIASISEWVPALQGRIDRQTPLLASGSLDSLGLYRLLLWIEQQAGQPVNAARVDIAQDWSTVDAVVAFVERMRARRAADAK